MNGEKRVVRAVAVIGNRKPLPPSEQTGRACPLKNSYLFRPAATAPVLQSKPYGFSSD